MLAADAVQDREAELRALRAMIREHLEWEAGVQGPGVPAWVGTLEPARRAGLAAGAEPPREGPVATAAAAPSRTAPISEGAVARAAPAAPPPEASVVAGPAVAPAGAPEGKDPSDKVARLRVLAEAAAACTACRLHEGRTRSVFARGTPDTLVAFVGEGPGYHEDQRGEPFVGAAGQLLDKMIAAMGFGRDDVYVCNVVKCRPPENRTPLPDEASACARFLVPQLEIVAPKVIVALGRCAAENLGCAEPGRSWRGLWGSWRGIPVMPTYHPAYLLRNPEMKRPVWEDLRKAMARIGRVPPSRNG